MGGAIPFSAIDRYAERFGFDGVESFGFFHSMVRLMDKEYIKIQSEKKPKS